jgi:hypothetical protein
VFDSKKSLLSIAVTLALAACGGGGGSTAEPAATSGTAVDGYLSGATVFCDTNGNGVLDTGEASVTTNASGKYTFTQQCSGTVVVTGGTNADTSYPFGGVLKTHAGASIASPLTTLMVEGNMTAAQLAAALGLGDIDVTKVDPITHTDAKLLKATLAIQQILQQLANGAGNGTNAAAFYAKVAPALAAAIKNGSNPLFGTDGSVDGTVLSAAITAALQANNVTGASVPALLAQLREQCEAYTKAVDGTELSELVKSLQNPNLAAPDTVNYLALKDDSITLNGTVQTLASVGTGVTLNGLSTASLQFSLHGTPGASRTASLGMELTEVGGTGRKLQVMIDKVNVTVTNGMVGASIPTDAKVYVFGHKADGTNVEVTLQDMSAFDPITVTDNTLNLHYDRIVSKVLDASTNDALPTAQAFTSLTGTFALKIAVHGLNVRHEDATPLTLTTVNVTGSGQSVMGAGISGSLTIQ